MAASGYINYNLLPSPLNSPALYPLPPPVPALAAYHVLMSSKRGRKRNDNLPPNRARDVQRAFRARRAAHLQALEDRVQELEEENDSLRAALNLPPANRHPLGRGPTGKDKPKPLKRSGGTAPDSIGSEGSASPRASTSSPHQNAAQLASGSTPGASGSNSGGGLWDHTLFPQHEGSSAERDAIHSAVPPSTSNSYTHNVPEPHFRFDSASPSRTRSSLSGAVYPSPAAPGYTHPADRPSTSSSSFSREDSYYSLATIPQGHASSSSLRHLVQSPSMQSHNQVPMGGGGSHSTLATSSAYGSAASGSSQPPQQQQHHQSHTSLSMALGLRRSIPDPQSIPSYVDAFPPPSYAQRAQPQLARQQPPQSPSDARLPPIAQRSGFASLEQQPDTASFRRAT